jgi:hypothetical protein
VVERGSTQHSGRVDDALSEEVEPLVRSGHESRASDGRLHEPPGDDEPLPDARITGDERTTPGLLDLDEIEARSELAASLRPSAFPADRATLLDVAGEQHATPAVMEALRALPSGTRFVNVQQVWEALGGERERRDVGDASVPTDATASTGADIEPDVVVEPVEVEIAIDLEVEAEADAEDEHAATVAQARPEPGTARGDTAAPGDPWWMDAVRTGVHVATIPMRVGAGALRFVRDRLPR